MSLNIAQAFASAVSSHQAGRFAEAEALYRNILAINPKHSQSLHLLGVIAHQAGRSDLAVELIGQAIALNGRIADFHNNIGEAHRTLGHLDEAIKHYRRAIKLKSNYADAHNNLGVALMAQGKLADAELHYRRALVFRPNYAEAYNNLGNLLVDKGKLAEAVARYEHALTLRPDYADAHNNLGVVLMWQDMRAEARDRFKRAMALRPDFSGALSNLGTLLLAEGKTGEALDAARRALELAQTTEGKLLFAQCVKDLRPIEDVGDLRDLVLRALTEAWGRPGELAGVAIALAKLNPAIQDGIGRVGQAWPRRLPAQELLGASGVTHLSEDRLFRCILETIPVTDIAFERFLTNLRLVLLGMIADDRPDIAERSVLWLASALARQCYVNEYVFAIGDDELHQARQLRDSLVTALESGTPVTALGIAAVAAYFPLHSLPKAQTLLERSWPEATAGLLAQQLSEYYEEQRLRPLIPRITPIEDEVSLLVRQQYEDNPYPRWVKASGTGKATTLDRHLRARFRLAPFHALAKTSDIEILIAGCGTGQHSIETARQFIGARVLAIDLSQASLCYAQRMTRNIGLDNITYAQADILKLGSIGRTFDVIEASGVLHHLGDPIEGWRVLLTLLRRGGLMRVGLYSELARAEVVAARSFIAERGYGQTADDIRQCRQEMMGFDADPRLKGLSDFGDFFSTSACRDLLFHVQEHRMTIPRIKAFLGESGLQFIGFDLDADVGAKYRSRFPDDPAMIDLDHWHAFETEHPRTFAGMYQFWIQKHQ